MSKLLKISVFAGGLATLGGPAFSQSTMPAAQQAYLKEICTKITRVQNSAESLGCVESLSDSLAAVQEGRIAAANDRDCRARGLANGTPQFAQCAIDRRYGGAADDAPALKTVIVPSDVAADNGWRFGTFAARHRREQASCAQLGIDPGSQVFVSCVNGLETALNSIYQHNG